MPELPEVETVRRGLEPAIVEKSIVKVAVNRPDLRWPFPPKMAERLTGARVQSLDRRSKYILANLSTEETLIIHLGMSGRILISGTQIGGFHHNHPTPQKHDHVVIDVEGGGRVTFNDPRRFGAMDLFDSNDLENHRFFRTLGPEPLGNSFNEDYLAAQLSERKTAIKSALLDQRIVAGLGNIYVCEALFRAGISPKRRSGQVSQAKVFNLVPIIRDVLNEAIAAGGSSLKDFRQADGELGYFQHAFQVYGRENEPCLTSGCGGTIERITQSGRSSFYCSTCQR